MPSGNSNPHYQAVTIDEMAARDLVVGDIVDLEWFDTELDTHVLAHTSITLIVRDGHAVNGDELIFIGELPNDRGITGWTWREGCMVGRVHRMLPIDA